jgi:hypothetical protein
MTNNKSATRSQHFDIKLSYMAGLIQCKVLDIAYVPTEHQVADMLTKDTLEQIFKRLSAFFAISIVASNTGGVLVI